ncbi:MAG: ATP-binding cassette domain-containing protein [Clostridia bacterium]|jgi:ABC-2 type transport system ATP-binding protein|nr:ATP-binding cassette domain-containing protein [Clostridia bacterium]
MGLKVKDVSKIYGNKEVVKNLSIEMNEPGVYGLLGANGAGKTTTIRMILGIIQKDKGTIEWDGKKISRENVKYGYLPEERGVYGKAKLYDQLIYFATLKGMEKEDAKNAIFEWCKRLGLEDYIYKPAEQLSKGNQQKVQLIIAIIHKPKLLILDEPFSGLDPVNTKVIKEVIHDLVKQGTYIILTSHQMSVVEEYCRDIVMLKAGKTVLQGNLNEIKKSYGRNNLSIETYQEIENLIPNNMKIIDKKANGYELKVEKEEDAQKLLEKLVENKIVLQKFELKEPSLQEIFIEKVGE